MRFLPSLCLALPLFLSTAALAEDRSIIVLDGSGSMWGQIDGRAKLEIAREALGSVLTGLPAETEIGLMAYGHRSKGDCGDIELVVPPGKGTGAAIISAANSMKFLGKTPLSDAVRRAAEQLRSTEEKATVILITDGIETCNADPCALGTELEASGVDFTAHVVGFGLTAEEGRAVACLAENTGGRYIEAKDAGGLVDALKTTMVTPAPEPAPPAPPPQPAKLEYNIDPVVLLAEGGTEPEVVLADAIFDFFPEGSTGDPGQRLYTIYGGSRDNLPAGKYVMKARIHKAETLVDVEISDTELAQPVAVLDAGILNLRVLAVAGGEPDTNAYFQINGPGNIQESGYARVRVVLPSGEYGLMTRLGAATSNRAFEIVADQTLALDVVMGVGVAAFETVYAEGVVAERDSIHIEIFEAKADINGNRKSVAYDWGGTPKFSLPPGDYIAVVKLDAAQVEVPLKVEAESRTLVKVNLNAGVAAFTTPGGEHVEIVSPTKDINGNQASIGYGFGPSFQLTLPAGDHVARVAFDGGTVDYPFTVKAGERLELSLAKP